MGPDGSSSDAQRPRLQMDTPLREPGNALVSDWNEELGFERKVAIGVCTAVTLLERQRLSFRAVLSAAFPLYSILQFTVEIGTKQTVTCSGWHPGT